MVFDEKAGNIFDRDYSLFHNESYLCEKRDRNY